jgi:hypothetical protein
MQRLFVVSFAALILLVASVAMAGNQPIKGPDPVPGKAIHCLQVPKPIRIKYPNPDGSCVLLSLGVSGIHSNDPKCTYLPFKSEYGPAERLGANPERIARIFAQRGIKGWNVTGKPSIEMARFAVKTGRGCALGFDYEHFQAVWGYDYQRKIWLIWDNRYPEFIWEYTEAQFEQMHNRSGRWSVVLEKPGDRIPHPTEW